MNLKKYEQRQFTSNVKPNNIINLITDSTDEADEEYERNNRHENYLTRNFHNSNDKIPFAAHRTLGKDSLDSRNLLLIEDYNDGEKVASKSFILSDNYTPTSPDNFNWKPLDTNYVTCSTNVVKNLAAKHIELKRDQSYLPNEINYSKPDTSAIRCADKNTYCRPVNHFYKQELVYKTMSRDARLQHLLTKIVDVRRREKQEVRWNNFINELKNKHGCAVNERRSMSPIPKYILTPDVIDEYYNTTFKRRRSHQYHDLLEDLCGTAKSFHPNKIYKPCASIEVPQPSSYNPSIYKNRQFCNPNSSQVSLFLWNKEMSIKNPNRYYHLNPSSKNFHSNTIVVDGERSTVSTDRIHFRKHQQTKCSLGPINQRKLLTSTAIQTELPTEGDTKGTKSCLKENSIRKKYEIVSKNVNRLKEKIENSQNNVESRSLTNIENKLNDLLHSINTCLHEIKSNCKFNRKIICRIAHKVSRSPLILENERFSRESNNQLYSSQLDDILHEEVDKSNRAKRDIENILNRESGPLCGVQLSIDIPTRERSTEVTASLSKTKVKIDKTVIDGKCNVIADRMTIAVNTDPLGLLALLKVSTETVKRILSYMPRIDYNSYLPMLQFPQCSSSGGVSHYVCSICGTAFGRPSQLSDHIRQHHLGKSRDCCVCRHVLDIGRHSLFSCRYCGNRFTRAYCCQLHEDSCAKRNGTRHDATSSLTLLR